MIALAVLLVSMTTISLSSNDVTWKESLISFMGVALEFTATGLLIWLGIQYVEMYRPAWLHYHPDLFTTVFECDTDKIRQATATKQAYTQTDELFSRQEHVCLQNKHNQEMYRLKKQLVRMKQLFVEQYKVSCDILHSKQKVMLKEESLLLPVKNRKSAMLEHKHELESQIEEETRRNDDLMERLERLNNCLQRSNTKTTSAPKFPSQSLKDLVAAVDEGSTSRLLSSDQGCGDTRTTATTDSPLHRCPARTDLLTGGYFVTDVTEDEDEGCCYREFQYRDCCFREGN